MCLKQSSAYAYDILIIAQTEQTLIDTFKKLKDISSQCGLIINENKTKYMRGTRRESHLDGLQVGNIQINQVRSFCYLGSIVNGDNTLEEEIKKELPKEMALIMQIKPFLKVNWCPETPN